MGSAFNMLTSFDLEALDDGGTRVKCEGDLSMFGNFRCPEKF